MNTKLGKVLNDSERLSSLKLHYPLIPWPTWSCDNFKKSFISTITRCMGSKSGKVLTYGRKFSIQTLKSSPNPCCVCVWDKKLCKCQLVFFLFFLLVDVFASTDKIFFSNFFNCIFSAYDQYMVNWSKSIQNLPLQQLKALISTTTMLLAKSLARVMIDHEELPPSHDPLIMRSFEMTCQTNIIKSLKWHFAW